MHSDHDVFISAIDECRVVQLTFFSKEDGRELVRTCAPMDWGPSRRSRDQSDRYHFWDIDSDEGSHTLSLLPVQVVSMAATDEPFEPGDFVTWDPAWHYPRDWGDFS